MDITQFFISNCLCLPGFDELHPTQAVFTTTTLAETAAITFSTNSLMCNKQ